ncbi:MAG: ABC-2 type transport system ATP-binding protein [Phycisphaerales bacterium]|jgi:ABC-2 type transport system ATP-binding protein
MSQVRKTFGKKVAVEGIDLVVPEGSLYGFIGPNGAGKTTTIRMIMAILFPDSGELSVLGRKSAVESKDQIGYLPEERGVYKKMKVASFLKHMAKLKGVSNDGLHQKVMVWLDRVGLAEVAKKKCEELSKGMQQKVQFICCVLHEPDLLILDEPFSGLDPVNMRLLRDLIDEQHQAGKTVLFSTHVMPQAESLCDHIVMIHNGQKVLDDSLDAIRSRFDPRAVLFEASDGTVNEALAAVGQLAGVASVRESREGHEAVLADGANPQEILRAIVGVGPMNRVELHRPTLEDVFIEMVSGSSGESAEKVRRALHAEHDGDDEGAGGNSGTLKRDVALDTAFVAGQSLGEALS